MANWWRKIVDRFDKTPKRVTIKDLGGKINILLLTSDKVITKDISEDMVLSGDSYKRLTLTNDKDIVFPPSNNHGWAKIVGTKVIIIKKDSNE